MTPPRILILQPSLLPSGGGNAVAVWMIEALREDHDLTVLLWERVDFDAINRHYGTSLGPDSFAIRYVPRWPELVRRLSGTRGALWLRHFMLRWGAPLARQYDMTLSVNGEIDVGVRAVQYVHYPWGYLPRPDADLRPVHRLPGLLPLYYRLGAAIAPVSDARIRDNLTLVNSDWTGARFRERYGGTTVTLYPPIFAAPGRRWEERDDAFLAIGRVAPEKELERTIAVVERVRDAGFPFPLRIVGFAKPSHPYVRRIVALAASRPWIDLRFNVTRAEMLDLIARTRYGIHSMEDEHFGMAITEMALAGCIPFVHASGGALEIVTDPRLTWLSEEEAAAKIVTVMRDDALSAELQAALLAKRELFSYERFRTQFRAVVAGFLASR